MGRIIQSTPEPAEVERKVITSADYKREHLLEYIDTGKTHRYILDGNRVPGATTVGGVYPKGEGLIRWMVQQGIAEYENKTALTKGADVGTVLHTYAECFEKGLPFDWKQVEGSPYETDIRLVLQRFDLWRQASRDRVLRMEDIVASPTLQVGGRIDSLRDRPGLGLVLHDYKTSKSIYITQLIQVIGGYRRMLREWLDIDVPYVEITTFPKQKDIETDNLLCDANGWTRNNNARVEIPGLFKLIEEQFERNLGTYRFARDVEAKLNPYK